MGSWGPGLYSDDSARDLRDTLKEIVRLPKDGAELLDTVLSVWPADDPEDDLYTTSWLVIADQFHRYGIAAPRVVETAARILDDGLDDLAMERLGMSGRDRAKRRAALQALRDGWSRPLQRPASRRLLAGPQPAGAAAGDVFAFPTAEGNPANTLDSAKFTAAHFNPDGWSVFVVARVAHRLDLFPVAYVIRLAVDRPGMPTIDAAAGANVQGIVLGSWGRTDPRPVSAWAPISPGILDRLGARRIGTLPLSWPAIEARLVLTEFDPLREPPPLFDLLTVWVRSMPDPADWDRPEPMPIRIDALAEDAT